MQEELTLELLVCPQDHTRLRMADDALIERINRAIAAGEMSNSLGRKLDKPLDGGLIREDGLVLYPIINEIPILLVDEAIALLPTDPASVEE
jgi:uncharacterized protein YbaR (Trm112 family)